MFILKCNKSGREFVCTFEEMRHAQDLIYGKNSSLYEPNIQAPWWNSSRFDERVIMMLRYRADKAVDRTINDALSE